MELTGLQAGQQIIFGGNKVTEVPADLAANFSAGDRLVVVNHSGDLIHIPGSVWNTAAGAVEAAYRAFGALGRVPDAAVSDFYEAFACNLEDDAAFAAIAAANDADVAAAKKKGRSTTRLVLSPSMRQDMIDGLRLWRDSPSSRDALVQEVQHQGWNLQLRQAGLGVVGFVFEGRPNVFADACGVIRSGNTVVFRIGSDALGTAKAIVLHALDPALAQAGLPEGSASLVASADRAAGHAMFSDPRLALAVARGSGAAVEQLGAVARQSGIPVSLHGTGGAWIVTGKAASADRLRSVVEHSLDRKVCNTLNTLCILREHAEDLIPAALDGLWSAAAKRGVQGKLHVASGSESYVDNELFTAPVEISRAQGLVGETQAETIALDQLGVEWEWEESPEITLVVVDEVGEAVRLFNEQSPRFAASLISDDPDEQDEFWDTVDAPFVGDGFTRWVDGQYALKSPELGLSNWQNGRLFARGGVLSGSSVFTVRTKVQQTDPELHR